MGLTNGEHTFAGTLKLQFTVDIVGNGLLLRLLRHFKLRYNSKFK